MTDDELLTRLVETPVEEWTAEELELLRRRAAENPALRTAIDEHLLLETVLTARLSRRRISADALLAKIDAERRSQLVRRSVAVGLVLLLALGLGGGAYWAATRGRPDPTAQVDRHPPVANGANSGDVSTTNVAGPPIGPPVAPASSTAPIAKVDPNTTTTTNAATATTGTDGVAEPWVAQLARAPRPFGELVFDERHLLQGAAAISRWWDLVSGQQIPLNGRDDLGLELRGAFKLRSPWPDDGLLSLYLRETNGRNTYSLRLSFWHGDDAVVLELRNRPAERWTAYQGRRRSPDQASRAKPTTEKAKPALPTLADLFYLCDDQDRGRRTSQAPSDFSYHDGRLYMSRGDVVLLSAPLPGPPEAVYLEGQAVVRSIGVARSTGFPDDWRPEPTPTWNDYTADTPLLSQLPNGASVERHGPASFTLKTDGGKQEAWVALPITRPGFHEVTFELESADPFTGIYLGDATGKPRQAVGLLEEGRASGKMLDFIDPRSTPARGRRNGDDPLDSRLRFPLHLRLVAGGGKTQLYASGDGVAWGCVLEPKREATGRPTSVGLFCAPGSPAKSIRVKNVAFRTLLTYDDAIAGEIPPLPGDYNYAAWVPRLFRGDETPEVRYHRLAKALAQNLTSEGERFVLGELGALACGDSPANAPKTVERDLEYVGRLARLADGWDTYVAANWVERIARSPAIVAEARSVADREAEEHDLFIHAPYSSVRKALLEESPLSSSELELMPGEPIRREIARLMLDGDWDRLDRACRVWHRFGGRPDPPGAGHAYYYQITRFGPRPAIMPLVDWAAAQAERRRDADSSAGLAAQNPLRMEWRHPLVEQFGKEGYNVLAELETALSEKAYADACRIISSVTAAQAVGVLPNAHDADLLTSLPGAVALAMKLHPELRTAMQAEYGELAMLRLKEAAADGDVDAVYALTTQFYGTSAAAQAQLWLGDRALAQGDAARAETLYAAAAREGSPDDADEIAARRRMAAAWQGRDFGSPPKTSVRFGEATVTPAEFERVVSTLRGRAAAPSARSKIIAPSTSPQVVDRLPPATGYELKPWAALDGDVGRSQDAPKKNFDYLAEQTSVAFTAAQMIVSNRFQIAAYDLKDGRRAWRTGLGNDQGRTFQWPGVAMPPVLAEGRIFVRRLPAAGPELVCLDDADGRLIWRSPKGEIVASDPLLLGDRIAVVTLAVPQSEALELSLTTFDAATGRVLQRRRIAQLRDYWKRELPCHLVAAEGMLVVSAAGCIIGCDGEGEPRWTRRLAWIPPTVDAFVGPASWTPPAVVENRVEVVQPGVPFRTIVDARTGSLIEQRLELREQRRSNEPPPPELTIAAAGTDELVGPIVEQIDRKVFRQRVVFRRDGGDFADFWVGPWSKQTRGAGPVVLHDGRLWAFTSDELKQGSRKIEELVPTAEQPIRPQTVEPITITGDWRRRVLGGAQMNMAQFRPPWLLTVGHYVSYSEKMFLENRPFLDDDCVLTHCSVGRPVCWSRDVTLPADRPATLRLRLASVGETSANVNVEIAGETVFKKSYEPGKKTQWHEERIDLTKFQGRRVRILLLSDATEKKTALVAWQSMEIEE